MARPARPPTTRAVDADELEVPADLQLDAPAGLGGVPAGDGRGDEVGDLVAVLLDQVADGLLDPPVHLGLQDGSSCSERPPNARARRRAGGGARSRDRRRRRSDRRLECRATASPATPAPSGCSSSSAFSCSPRAISAGSVRSRTASSAHPDVELVRAARGRGRRPPRPGSPARRRRSSRRAGRRSARAPTTATRCGEPLAQQPAVLLEQAATARAASRRAAPGGGRPAIAASSTRADQRRRPARPAALDDPGLTACAGRPRRP